MVKQLALVVVIGCAAAPPEPLHTPIPIGHSTLAFVSELSAPMPHLDDVPDFDPTPAGRWPLTLNEHPELEPHFAIANALAQPGISWLELCNRGAQSRHMTQNAYLGDYLAAWCSVANDDYRDAIDRLAPLRGEHRLHDAIELDISAILVADATGTSVSEANHMNVINAHIADLTSASYFEIGKLDAALAMSGYAAQMDRSNSEELYCKRLAHEYAVSSLGNRGQIELHLLHPEAFDEKVRCLDLKRELEPRASREKTGRGLAARARIVRHMDPRRRTGGSVPDLEIRYRFATAALEMALRTSICSHTNLETLIASVTSLRLVENPNYHASAPLDVDTHSKRIPLFGDLQTEFEPRLDELVRVADTASHMQLENCASELHARADTPMPW